MALAVCQNQRERSRLSFVAASPSRCGLCSLSSAKSAHLFAARVSAGAFLALFSCARRNFPVNFPVPFRWATCSRVIPLRTSSPRPHHGFGLDCGLGREHLRLVRDRGATQRLLEQHQPEVNICPRFASITCACECTFRCSHILHPCVQQNRLEVDLHAF